MEPGGKGSFQAVKLQRPARTTVCSHSTRDMAAMGSIESKHDIDDTQDACLSSCGQLWSETKTVRKGSRLNCGLCRARGILRTSMTHLTQCASRISRKAFHVRVECPIVKTVSISVLPFPRQHLFPCQLVKREMKVNYPAPKAIENFDSARTSNSHPALRGSTLDLAHPSVTLPTEIGGIFRNCAKWGCMASISISRWVNAA
jgi:hypothetical protein